MTGFGLKVKHESTTTCNQSTRCALLRFDYGGHGVRAKVICTSWPRRVDFRYCVRRRLYPRSTKWREKKREGEARHDNNGNCYLEVRPPSWRDLTFECTRRSFGTLRQDLVQDRDTALYSQFESSILILETNLRRKWKWAYRCVPFASRWKDRFCLLLFSSPNSSKAR